MKKFLNNIFAKKVLILTIIFCQACAFFNFSGSNIETLPNDPTKDANARQTNQMQDKQIDMLSKQTEDDISLLSDVEILWLIPNENVEGFILSYGFDTNNINNKIQISTSELEEVAHPNYNKVYRYILRNIPKDKELFIQLTAFTGSEFSNPTKIFTLRTN